MRQLHVPTSPARNLKQYIRKSTSREGQIDISHFQQEMSGSMSANLREAI